MKPWSRFILLAASVLPAFMGCPAVAQNLAITNIRIIDSGSGTASNGNLVIRNGRIAAQSDQLTGDLEIIDGAGLTAVPGFIDGHRHVMSSGDPEVWLQQDAATRMQEFLDAGFTTVMEGAGPVPWIVTLRDALESGALQGPRLVSSGRVDISGDPALANLAEQVQVIAEAGVEIIKVTLLDPEDADLLQFVVSEAGRYELDVMVHAVTVPTTIAAVSAGAARLVHTPTRSFAEETNVAELVREADVAMASTLGIWVPIYSDDNLPLFRDRSRFADEGWTRAGVGPVNGRHLYDAGVIYGFGTDTNFLPVEALAHELRPLALVFSNRDILRIMGPNSAEFVGLANEIGTLTPGKLADIVLVEGNPLENIQALLNVKLVLKGGRIVADHR